MTRARLQRWTGLVATAALLAATGCADSPYRTNAGLGAQADAIERVGLLPPLVTVYQEQAAGLQPELVRREEWTQEAADNLRRAFAEELGSAHQSLAEVDPADHDVAELEDLFSAVDRSVTRHAYADSPEQFPESTASLDYSLGSAAALTERRSVDALWIVAGANLVPTAGAQARDAFETLMAIAAALGRAPVSYSVLDKLDLRAALVGSDGTILFFCRIRAGDVVSDADAAGGDLRSRAFARRVVRTVLRQYAKATAP